MLMFRSTVSYSSSCIFDLEGVHALLELNRSQRVCFQQWMNVHILVEQQMLQLGVTLEDHSKHLCRLPLVPVGSGPNARYRRNPSIRERQQRLDEQAVTFGV